MQLPQKRKHVMKVLWQSQRWNWERPDISVSAGSIDIRSFPDTHSHSSGIEICPLGAEGLNRKICQLPAKMDFTLLNIIFSAEYPFMFSVFNSLTRRACDGSTIQIRDECSCGASTRSLTTGMHWPLSAAAEFAALPRESVEFPCFVSINPVLGSVFRRPPILRRTFLPAFM
jgi:hypothetical protein